MAFLLDPAETALVLIDLQHGIVGLPLAPRSGQTVAVKGAELAEAFRAAGAGVFYVHVALAEMQALPVDRPMHDPAAPPPPPVASELVPEAGRQPGDMLITKRQWGAFTGTPLNQLLRRRGVTTLVLGGIATNLGVESTARAAVELGYAVVLAEDAATSISADAHAFAVETIFPLLGRVRGSAAIKAALAH